MDLFEESKIIKLGSGKEYIIVKNIEVDEKIYLLLNEIDSQEELLNEIKICTLVKDSNNIPAIIDVENPADLELIAGMFEIMIEEETE